jgi:ATP-dependent exoDNAse (exonuclease V) beta subunit
MNQFQNAIITASAGTGKTYRLSIEFISLILKYYEDPDFKLDSILALTFTRKATAEIRERIMSHLEELIAKPEGDLVESLRKHIPGDPQTLSMKEQNILLSAYREISADLQNLQIMTIDSYTANIFRNIVRPMKSIDDYDIDQDAIKKSMPLLMNHLMKPEFHDRINQLLSRKVHRSLDDYSRFFESMIYNRWLYFLITKRCSLHRQYQQQARKDFPKALRVLGDALQTSLKDPAKKGFADVFLTDIKKLYIHIPNNPDEFCSALQNMLHNPTDAMKLYGVFKKSSFFAKAALTKEGYETCLALYREALEAMAETLYYDYFLPEEREILDVWGIILEEYDKLIYRYKKLNYQDIAWLTFEALFSNDPPEFKFNDENSANEFYMFLSHRTRFMLIDEFQDTSLIQFNMLRPIMEEISSGYGSKDFGGLVVVGDEKQSIFGWRGGERDLLLNLNRIIPSLKELEIEALDKSWRSSADMVNFINAAFADQALHAALKNQNMNWPYAPISSAIGDLDSTIELRAKGYSNMHRTGPAVFEYFVDEMIIPELKRNPKASIAILCRKTKQLSTLQLLLEERGETGVFQPSAPISEHHLVAPLINWLRFVAYGDWLDFLAFIRSDYLLISSAALKAAIDEISAYEPAKASPAPLFSSISPLSELHNLAARQHLMPPYAILREITVLCMPDPARFPERDLLNVQAFLNLAATWELSEAHKGLKITDWLDYLDENVNQEGFTQVSVESTRGVQLLTFHKSKGLQFDKVFVYYDLSTPDVNEKNLFWASDYLDHEFRYIKDYALSFHFAKILPESPARGLWENKQKQERLEELNNLYVAFTRAKADLHVLFAYHSTAPWQDYLASKQEQPALPLILADACGRWFSEEHRLPDGSFRVSTKYPAKEPKPGAEAGALPGVLDSIRISEPRHSPLATALPKPSPELDYKAVYLDKRHALYGDLTHYYLSFILHDTPDQHSRATRESMQRYGSILGTARISRTLESIRRELYKHSYLFDSAYDKVFTEFAIGAFRVDRLMLNTQSKEALIVDFKTGGIHEQEQLEIYQKALCKHPALCDYRFSTRYVKLEIL